MPYTYERQTRSQILQEQLTTRERELRVLRQDLAQARAELDAARKENAERWTELVTLHRIFDKLLIRLEKYEGSDIVNTSRIPAPPRADEKEGSK